MQLKWTLKCKSLRDSSNNPYKDSVLHNHRVAVHTEYWPFKTYWKYYNEFS